MAIVTCPDCGYQMSDAAPACPKCGRPNLKKRSVGLLLGIGIFFIPLIFSWLTLRKGHSGLARALSFSWLLMSVVLIAVQDEPSSRTAAHSAAAASAYEDITEVDIRDILSAYEANEVDADNRFKGRLIQVTGIIDSIKKDLIDNLYVTLGTGRQFELPQIQAFFDDSMSQQLGQLRVGAQLTVVCRVDGLMMNVLANDCVIR